MGIDPRVLPPLFREARRDRFTVLHAHDSHALTLARLVAARTKIPLVATRRVTFPPRHPRACSSWGGGFDRLGAEGGHAVLELQPG